jgi:hypothetical protein
MQKQEALELALKYGALGIPAFPVGLKWLPDKGKYNKFPLNGAGGHNRASTDQDEIKRQFNEAQTTDAEWGVGLRPGVAGYIVLDIDSKQGSKALEAEGLPRTAQVNTLQGYHLWFKKPYDELIANANGTVWPDVDVRADGGFVMAPGTVATRARWSGLRVNEIVELPRRVFERLTTMRDIVSEDNVSVEEIRETEADQDYARAVEWCLRKGAVGVARIKDTKGKTEYRVRMPGKNSGWQASIGMGQRGAGSINIYDPKWPDPETDKMLPAGIHHVDDWEFRDDHGFFPEEMRLKNEPQRTKRKREPGKTLEQQFRDEMLDLDGIEAIEPPEFLIDGWLVRDSLAELFGDPGVGKSFVALDWALHIATGRDWLGVEVKKPEPVMYIIGEGRATTGDRTRVWQDHHGRIEDAYRKNIMLKPSAVNLTDPEEVLALLPIAEEYQPALIIIDTLARSVVGADGNSDKEMGLAIDAAEQLREATGACVLLLHHSGHNAKDRGRGSSAILGALETDIKLSGTHDKLVLQLTKQKSASDDLTKQLMLVKIQTHTGQESLIVTDSEHLVEGVEEPEFGLNEKHLTLLSTLEEVDEGNGVGSTAWKKVSAISDAYFYKLIKELTREGYVEQGGTKARPTYKLIRKAFE